MGALRPGAIILERFQVEAILPEETGGFSRVCIARWLDVDDARKGRVALKLMRVQIEAKSDQEAKRLNETYKRALHNEVEILRQLHHPGIVRIYPIFAKEGGMPYLAKAVDLAGQPWFFAMEYLGGGSVEAMVRQRGPLDPRLAAEIAYQVATILDYVHSQGYAHLDIKLSNVMFRRPIADLQQPDIVLIDFGSAQKKQLRAEVEAGALVYLPPERVRIRQGAPPEQFVDKPAADMYSLGVSLYRMLTGKLPFTGKQSHVETAILEQRPTAPSSLNPELKQWPDLEQLVLHMMAKNPEDRPRAKDVAARLDRLFPPPRLPALETEEMLPLLYRRQARWRRIAAGSLAFNAFFVVVLLFVAISASSSVGAAFAPPEQIPPTPVPVEAGGDAEGREGRPNAPVLSPSPSPTPSAEPSPTPSFTPPFTPTATPSPKPSPTPSPSPTSPPTATPVPTFTPTPTPKPRTSPTFSPTPTSSSDAIPPPSSPPATSPPQPPPPSPSSPPPPTPTPVRTPPRIPTTSPDS